MSAPVARPRRVVVGLAVLFVLLVTGTGAMALTSEGLRSTTERDSTLVARAEQLTVYNSAGNIRLVPSVDDAVHVHTHAEFGLRAPRLVEASTPTGVVLQAQCADAPAMNCTVDYTIEVPPDFALRISAMSGVVTARALTGQVAVDVGSGAVRLFDLSGPVTVRGRDAQIDALGLTSDSVVVSNLTGDVSLDLLGAPASIQARTTFGDLDIAVPGEQRYRVSASSTAGSQRVGIGVDPASAHTITASTEYGSIRVRPTGTDPDEYRSADVPRFPGPPMPPKPPEPPMPPLPPEPPVPPS